MGTFGTGITDTETTQSMGGYTAMAAPAISLEGIEGDITPLPSSQALREHAEGLGSPAVPVWLIAPCHFDGLGGVVAGAVGCVDL